MISQNLVNALGWTLVHSIWEAFAVAVILFAVFKIFPPRKSNLRYALSVGGMATLVVGMVITFFVQLDSANAIQSTGVGQLSEFKSSLAENVSTSGSIVSTVASKGMTWVNNHIDWLITFWMIGIILFSVRLAGGIFYVSLLRQNAEPISESIENILNNLKRKLQITIHVSVAESAKVNSPLVIGYLKPIILFPAGLMSGLSTQQVEMILLHELSHIRRHDYLVNLIQSIVEVVLFYNPFAWFISSLIREERENCCDDLAIRHTADSLGYSRTLAMLEELRFKTTIAMTIAGSKNQLFRRIQRIMENSIQKDTARSRVWPLFVLVVVALISASWVTYSSDNGVRNIGQVSDPLPALDTLKKEKRKGTEKSATYSRKSITTVDEDGQPHEEIVEEFEGDESLRPMVVPSPDFDFGSPVPMVYNFPMDEFFSPEDLAALEELRDLDTIPAIGFEIDGKNWEDFARRLSEQFQNDFSGDNGRDIEDMLNRLSDQMAMLGNRFNDDWARDFEWKMKENLERLEDRLKDSRESEELMRLHADKIRKMEELIRDRMERVEEHMTDFRKFDAELRDQLVKDGYLKQGEEVNTINWGEDGELRVNGKKIKEGDQEKYQKIRRKYFTNSKGRPE